MPNSKKSKNKPSGPAAIDRSIFVATIPGDLDDETAGKIRVEIAREVAAALIAVQLRHPDTQIKMTYEVNTGTRPQEIPLV